MKVFWLVSVSVAVRVPDASEVSSCAAPVVSPPIVAASFRPLIVIVTVCAVPSALVTEKVSVIEAPAARAWTALLESVSVNAHSPPEVIV